MTRAEAYMARHGGERAEGAARSAAAALEMRIQKKRQSRDAKVTFGKLASRTPGSEPDTWCVNLYQTSGGHASIVSAWTRAGATVIGHLHARLVYEPTGRVTLLTYEPMLGFEFKGEQSHEHALSSLFQLLGLSPATPV